MIKDPERFANEVIPQYFDHNKFSSFTRQLNFYKFTREQSKVIKKSDHSSEVAKHQTFHHKFFQREHPELLKNLQRSRKGNSGEDEGHSTIAKKISRGLSSGGSMLEQISDLLRRANESEAVIKNLQQENSTLSFAIQKLQQQDEMKQRALVALEEHVRVMEVHMTQAFQQQQAQIQQGSQPLPFARESSLSAVNPSTLMRYLSMNGGLNSGLNSSLQRLATPPPIGGLFGRDLSNGGGLAGRELSQGLLGRDLSQGLLGRELSQGNPFSAAAAAENIVHQASENSAATNGVESGGLGRMNQTDNFAASANGNSGPTIKPHPKMKGRSTAAAVAAVIGNGGGGDNGGNVASLPRHPKFKGGSSGPAPGAPAASGVGSMARGGFMEGNNGPGASLANASAATKADTLVALGARNRNGSNSPMPPALTLNNFGGGGSSFGNNFSSLGSSIAGFNNAAANALRGNSSVSPVPGLSNFPNNGNNHNNGATVQQQQQTLLQQRELSNMAGGVSREESFGIESLMEMARGPHQI